MGLEPGRSVTQAHGTQQRELEVPHIRALPLAGEASLKAGLTLRLRGLGEKGPAPGGQILFALKEVGPQRLHSGATRPLGAWPGLTSRCSANHRAQHLEPPLQPQGPAAFQVCGDRPRKKTLRGLFCKSVGWANPMLLPGNLTDGTSKLPVALQEARDAGLLAWGLRRVSQAKACDGFQGRDRTNHGEDFFCTGAGGNRAAVGTAEHLLVTLRGEARRRSMSAGGPPPSCPWGPATDTGGGAGKAPLSCQTGRALMRNSTPERLGRALPS